MSQMIFTKYSAERSKNFAIRTDIVKREDGTLEVEKRALYPEGQAHVADIFKWYQLLLEEYEEKQFLVNHCVLTPKGVCCLSFLTGGNAAAEDRAACQSRKGRGDFRLCGAVSGADDAGGGLDPL